MIKIEKLIISSGLLFFCSLPIYADLEQPKQISVSVPIASNNIERPSGLYVDLFTQEPRKTVKDFFQDSKGAGEQTLASLIGSISEDNFDYYKTISIGLEKDKKYIFKQGYSIKKSGAFDNPDILYKMYLGNDLSYVLQEFFHGSERTFSFYFLKEGQKYLFDSRNITKPINSAIDAAMRREEILTPDIKYIFPYTAQPYTHQLISGQYPVEVGYKKHWVVNRPIGEFSSKNVTDLAPTIRKIGQFYQQIQEQLVKRNLEAVFDQMEPKSVERFTGNHTDFNVAELSDYVLNMAVPDTLAMVIDADPFYIVYGTNFTRKYQQALSLQALEDRAEALRAINLQHTFLIKQEDGEFKLTHLRSNRAIDRLLQDPHFKEQVIINTLVGSTQ